MGQLKGLNPPVTIVLVSGTECLIHAACSLCRNMDVGPSDVSHGFLTHWTVLSVMLE